LEENRFREEKFEEKTNDLPFLILICMFMLLQSFLCKHLAF